MKPSKIVWVFVALLVTTVCYGDAERRQVAQADPTSFAGTAIGLQTADHGGKIESKYDGFSNETIVRLNKMRVTCGTVDGNFKDICISFVAELHCPGTQLDYVRYVRLQVLFQTKDWTKRHPLAERQLSVVANTETLRLGQMKLVSQSVNELMTEVLEVEVPYAIFTKIAQAQTVDIKVGNTTFELGPKNLEALKDLNNRVKF